MFTMNKGLLYSGDTPVFGMGMSYYPSFHDRKCPVPQDGDRIGEMKKDLRLMREAGFNIVRTAALGHVSMDKDGKVNVETPFIDMLMDEADKVDIATMVRIQGYEMCYHDFSDSAMINENGEALDRSSWSNFIQNCLHHEGVLADNKAGTEALAKHYEKYKNLVSYITYNEPHYPGGGIFDYNPHAAAAYRKWLVKKGIMTEKQAENVEPPKRRPISGENIYDWVNWRLFALESMVDFLNDSAQFAKDVCPKAESMTCMTPQMVETMNFCNCVEYFDVAQKMDTVGITLYKNGSGGDYFTTDLTLSCAESAAAVYKKHLWLVEYDAATNIPIDKFNRQTYLAVGNGAKGIMYYQWRGDYPFDDAPEPNGFGILNYDGTKTANYDNALCMAALMNKLSPYLINAEKQRSGAAILHSDHASFLCDATENCFIDERTALGTKEFSNMYPNPKNKKIFNSCIKTLRMTYAALREKHIMVDIVKSEHLKENNTNVRALFVPAFELLSEKEKREVREFAANGGMVYILSDECWHQGLTKAGFDILDKPRTRFNPCYSIDECLEIAGIKAIIKTDCNSHELKLNILEGADYYVVSLTNASLLHEIIKNAKLKTAFEAKSAVFYDTTREVSLEICGNKILLPEVHDGGLVVIKK